MRHSMSQYLIDQIAVVANISVENQIQVTSVEGEKLSGGDSYVHDGPYRKTAPSRLTIRHDGCGRCD